MANNNQNDWKDVSANKDSIDDWQDMPVNKESIDDWQDISEETPLSLSESDFKEIPQLPRDEVTAPAIGYLAGKATQKRIESVVKLPEKLATTLGGLSPEQVDYLQKSYKEIESGKGISQEAVEEAFLKLENVFKQKNIQANRARELAEQSLEVPLTKELMEKAASQALPKVMDKIEPKKEAFQKTLKERTQAKVESEIDRLTNLLEQKKQAVIDASDYAQSRAEKAASEAVKNIKTSIKPGTLELESADTENIYNKAFEEELKKSIPEQNKIQAKDLK